MQLNISMAMLINADFTANFCSFSNLVGPFFSNSSLMM